MKVTFDPAKRAATLADRGLDMADAECVFDGPHDTVEDDRDDYGEDRWITFGWLSGRLVVVIWTLRGTTRRIISLRKANDREQAKNKPSL